MPTCVLYSDEDLEPITAIDVPSWAYARLQHGERIEMCVAEEPPFFVSKEMASSRPPPIRRVLIWTERFTRKGRDHLFLFTRDDLHALRLEPEYLPGQRCLAQEAYRRAFADGFSAALLRMYGR